ncbi:hypothetical protein ACFFWC_16160 [Plantactinospora siamensis]|uniref:Uncharacterized protein n=1 Tax=Plantactinospora siamensis TaxID=555372 RepID=A0ABV6NX21_9ACTN
MSLWIAAMWGFAGSIVAEALNLYGMMRPTTESKGRWQWPWRDPRDRPIMLLAIALRAFAGTLLAAVTAASGLATSPLAAFNLGITAPLVIAKLFDQDRVLDQSSPPDPRRPGGDDDDGA